MLIGRQAAYPHLRHSRRRREAAPRPPSSTIVREPTPSIIVARGSLTIPRRTWSDCLDLYGKWQHFSSSVFVLVARRSRRGTWQPALSRPCGSRRPRRGVRATWRPGMVHALSATVACCVGPLFGCGRLVQPVIFVPRLGGATGSRELDGKGGARVRWAQYFFRRGRAPSERERPRQAGRASPAGNRSTSRLRVRSPTLEILGCEHFGIWHLRGYGDGHGRRRGERLRGWAMRLTLRRHPHCLARRLFSFDDVEEVSAPSRRSSSCQSSVRSDQLGRQGQCLWAGLVPAASNFRAAGGGGTPELTASVSRLLLPRLLPRASFSFFSSIDFHCCDSIHRLLRQSVCSASPPLPAPLRLRFFASCFSFSSLLRFSSSLRLP